jgi:hypothetical protein
MVFLNVNAGVAFVGKSLVFERNHRDSSGFDVSFLFNLILLCFLTSSYFTQPSRTGHGCSEYYIWNHGYGTLMFAGSRL